MLAICASHSPLMLTGIEATDPARQQGFRDALARARAAIERYDPQLVVVFGPDHFNGLFFDLMPSFCVGIAAESTRDWGLPAEQLDIPRATALACVDALREARFDVAVSYRLKVDHGTTIPLQTLTAGLRRYPVVPIVVNCAAAPRPSFRRSHELGAAVGEFLRERGERIVVIGSGGLSHDPPTPRIESAPAHVVERLIVRHTPSEEELAKREARVLAAARALVAGEGPCQAPSESFDREFLDAWMRGEAGAFDRYSDEFIDREAGFGGHELRCWVAALAALQAIAPVQTALEFYAIVPEWITGMGIAKAWHPDAAAAVRAS
jgi:2,3-dihydroxyphenylpropionate 1,2-dioxygenase